MKKPNRTSHNILDIIECNMNKANAIEDVVDNLNTSDRDFICLKYGLLEYESHGVISFTALSKIIGWSRSKVIRRHNKIIKELKDQIG